MWTSTHYTCSLFLVEMTCHFAMTTSHHFWCTSPFWQKWHCVVSGVYRRRKAQNIHLPITHEMFVNHFGCYSRRESQPLCNSESIRTMKWHYLELFNANASGYSREHGLNNFRPEPHFFGFSFQTFRQVLFDSDPSHPHLHGLLWVDLKISKKKKKWRKNETCMNQCLMLR